MDEYLKRAISDIEDLKSNQFIGGDSWLVYRTETNFTAAPSQKFRIDFKPDTDTDFVAELWITNPDRSYVSNKNGVVPDPVVNGRWWLNDPVFSSVPRTAFVYSTQKGSLVVTLV